MIKRFIFAAAFVFAVATPGTSHARASIGGLLASPEIVGGYLSLWPNNDVSLDFRATLTTLDAGVTGHIPISSAVDHRHDIVVSGLGGWVHAGSHYYYDGMGARVAGMVGYGYQSSLDFRVMGGVTSYKTGDYGWVTAPTFVASLGVFL